MRCVQEMPSLSVLVRLVATDRLRPLSAGGGKGLPPYKIA
jgi:hypothetical protein